MPNFQLGGLLVNLEQKQTKVSKSGAICLSLVITVTFLFHPSTGQAANGTVQLLTRPGKSATSMA